MVELFPTQTTILIESTTKVMNGIPILVNTTLAVDSICTTGRASINFYCSPNPVSKVFFGASCLCGVLGAGTSGTALVTSFVGIPVAEWLETLGARGFNRLGKCY